MDFSLWESIKKKQFSHIYVLVGEESYLLDKTRDLIIENALSEQDRAFNLITFDLTENTLDEALDEMCTYPFLGDKRVVIMKNAFFLSTGEKKIPKLDHNVERLATYLDDPATFTIGVFIVPNAKLDERKNICKKLHKKATIFKAVTLKEQDLISWIIKYAGENNGEIESEECLLLISLTGTKLQTIKNEIDKLLLAVDFDRKITKPLILSLVVKTLEYNVFVLVEQIMNDNIKEALATLNDLILQKEEPIRILGAIAYQYRVILLVKILHKRGSSLKEMSKELGISTYPLQIAMKRIHLFSEEKLFKKLVRLSELDYEMKTSSQNQGLLLDLFILQNSQN